MKIIIAIFIILSTAGYFFIQDSDENLTHEDIAFLAVENTFDEFLSVNSVRERRNNWLTDQYSATKSHRIFAMDARLFTGEEIVKRKKGRNYIVDKSIPHDEYPNDRMGFNPAKGAGGFDFDQFLLDMKTHGYNSIPVVSGNLLYTNVQKDSMMSMHQLPWDDGGNRENPMDYKAYASFLYQFAARYGKNKLVSDGGSIDPATLKLASNNQPKAGLDLIEAIEPGNEMDRDWFSSLEEATPTDLAAFLSAAIDGHMGLMGEGHGIRNADPNMKIVFPGPIDIKPDYLLEVKERMLEMRKDAEKYGYPVNPFSNFVITAHAYPVYDKPFKEPPGRPNIEKTDIFERSLSFIQIMKNEFPGNEYYLTEIGYDKITTAENKKTGVPTLESDPVLPKGISPFAQARQISRVCLSMYGSGFDRMYLFTLKDPVAIGGGFYKVKFSTSGLVRKNGDKDLAWFVVNGLRTVLSGYNLKNYSKEADLHTMTFSQEGKPDIQALWLSSNNGSTKPIKLNEVKSGKRIFELSDSNNPEWLKGKPLDKNTSLTITEFPVLIEL